MSAPPTSTTPSRVSVVGGGRMGAGIAHAFLLAGSEVTVVERDAKAAEAARARVEASIDASLKRGLGGERSSLIRALTVSCSVDAVAGAQLVVEAVPEILELKLDTLSAIEQRMLGDAVLATNTSSIPLSQLSSVLEHPSRFIGLHFFNPVPASQMVEVVVSHQVLEPLVLDARSWVHALGKKPVVVTDSPGFASTRLGLALALEAMRMVEEEVAAPEDIDTAMELGYRHPVGPLRTTDIVGLDVRLGIAEQLERDLGPRFRAPQLLRDMVSEGRLGRKSGQGFYKW